MSDADGQRRVLSKVLKEIHEEHGSHEKTTAIETMEDYCPKCPDDIENPEQFYRSETE
jgi:hypothetical protein